MALRDISSKQSAKSIHSGPLGQDDWLGQSRTYIKLESANLKFKPSSKNCVGSRLGVLSKQIRPKLAFAIRFFEPLEWMSQTVHLVHSVEKNIRWIDQHGDNGQPICVESKH